MKKYYNYLEKDISELEFIDLSSGNAHRIRKGFNKVIDIKEHMAGGEGDKFFYDIIYEDDTVFRIFNPGTITYKFIE